jgi:hypothetical protein
MATKTTTMGNGDDIDTREILPRGGHRVQCSQEQIAAAAPSRLGPADIDEDTEVPSVGDLIHAVLNSHEKGLDDVDARRRRILSRLKGLGIKVSLLSGGDDR